jgi:two-component system phosphate regulon sensor histidine kinase PhoR
MRSIAMVVHDLRNPLGVIAGYVSALSDGNLGLLSAEQENALHAVDRQVQVLSTSIEQLLELDRVERHPSAQSSVRFDLDEFFSELRETRFAHLERRIVWPGPESRFAFVGDRQRIASIVQNLIDNAIRHGGGGVVRVDCTRRSTQLVLTIVDGGPELPAEVRAALVTPSHERDLSASGLGIHIVTRHLLHLGATVAVRGAVQGGNEIEVSIPALPVSPGSSSPRP